MAAGPQSNSIAAPYVSKVWIADNGDGTYKNPILYADYSDPDVIRVGDDYYMTASSFTCFPGLPILHSKDLVNWTLIGHAVPQYPDALFDLPQHGKGIWAPAIRFHDEHFYIFWGDPDAGIYMVKSKNPAGPWDKPVLALAGKGLIDTCPLWDEDGNAYIVHGWAGSRTGGFNSVLTVRRMKPDGTEISPEGRHVFDGHDRHPTLEGPKFYKRNGYYYIFAPAGGVTTGWQTILRSKSIWGPYEDKIVLDQGTTSVNGPHQGGWIETPSGQSWFIHFQDAGAYGRIVHLQPVKWVNDWPVMGIDKDGDGKGEPVLTFAKPDIKGHFPIVSPAESDEFDTDTLGLQWQWQGNPQITWYALLPGKDYLRLFALPLPHPEATLWDTPQLLLQKFPAPDFSASVKITLTPVYDGKRAGLIIMGDDYACLSLNAKQQKLWLTQSVCLNAVKGGKEKILAEYPMDASAVYLQVQVSSPDAQCRFRYSLDGQQYREIGDVFTAKAGRWVGAKVGLFCLSDPSARAGGYADFDWFRIDK
ncbi:MAG TPA: glycoside hydrolase 43 family protein [Anaerohalosphaeraceae bacterium]|nr:glycoside hydrolase 43 family protein [Phycisphaerae bacterium]HOK96094.1 glycoside hydrolase 43 family protein [Anaerohalosphaeraceae bacterium]HOL32224.1 glycoside hydrolase 43 family protein [Anaerohalosphaeraceae bacterium]HOM76612.1 glycoside hydrolase 43 family protein [Anaerohalosphaeraceae bacterium]HPC63582.1 glycoside hydrolase 43 family protein [Anaerohalosphaeraceae bacterium]